MSTISNVFFKLCGIPKSRIYIETGTYRGDNLRKVIGQFDSCISIELDKDWYDFNDKYFSVYKNVTLIYGDSSEKLKSIKLNINDCVTIFLDAHFSGPTTARGNKDSPLLKELEVLKAQLTKNVVIIIDDARLLGQSGWQMGDGRIYLPFESDWSDITLMEIKNRLPLNFKILGNTNRWASTGNADQLICFQISNRRWKLIKFYDSLRPLHTLGITSRHNLIYRIKKLLA